MVSTLVVLALAFTYVLLKIDVHETARIIRSADPLWVALSVVLIFVMILPMSWRWQQLLRAREIRESLAWLMRAYFVGFTVGQVLPTSVGGDASRIYETAKRHRGEVAAITGSVLVERALGGVVTLLLAAVGFLLATLGRYPIGAYLWIEFLLVFGAIVLGFVFFSHTARERLVIFVPLRAQAAHRAARADDLRGHPWLPKSPGDARRLSSGRHGRRADRRHSVPIYAAGRAVGIHVSVLAYVVLGPLLFLVTLLPFTINGLGVREAFFVNPFAKLNVPADAAFACGFLFFLTSLALALPGLGILLREGFRRHPAPDASI